MAFQEETIVSTSVTSGPSLTVQLVYGSVDTIIVKSGTRKRVCRGVRAGPQSLPDPES